MDEQDQGPPTECGCLATLRQAAQHPVSRLLGLCLDLWQLRDRCSSPMLQTMVQASLRKVQPVESSWLEGAEDSLGR